MTSLLRAIVPANRARVNPNGLGGSGADFGFAHTEPIDRQQSELP